MKFLKYVGLLMVALFVIVFFGPKVSYDKQVLLDTDINIPISGIESYVADVEAKVKDMKPDNQARIIWANDSLKQKTAYSIVYLHGFSASQEEGDPVHTDFAKRYGCNLYLARLEDHGRLDSNTFINLTPDNFLQSAEDAIDIGKILGEKVIVMSCSTGGTLAAILASSGENIHSMIMFSPNIEIYDSKSELLLYPWGKQLSELVLGGNHNHLKYKPEQAKYWNEVYHTNGLFAIKTLIKDNMNQASFSKITMPVFIGYYYKDETNQDKVVSVKRMIDFYNEIGTPEALKRKVAFPTTGHHVISSHVMSEDIQGVENETFKWAEEVLGLKPVEL